MERIIKDSENKEVAVDLCAVTKFRSFPSYKLRSFFYDNCSHRLDLILRHGTYLSSVLKFRVHTPGSLKF
ncbi:unnamed protein product [Eruca vesicaria subsp. sativa]|uniref:Uncharacterized protein n=1 Tax=Eruca vesicaria subsp. sativa TaxID=29727 RepID=A0ABC8KFI7_ERUVS|nr:unnamed protein product [Eruca vesicaria subsp. sativa]